MVNRYLLDTHTLIWWWAEPEKLSPKVIQAISNPSSEVYVSSATIWEIATKYRKGKLTQVEGIFNHYVKLLEDDDFTALDITLSHAAIAGLFSQQHQDPFDRMSAAQSILENLTLISCDSALSQFPVQIYW
ncbi:type II toxin-antitoxin system VapC family toxin [Glaesserella parasuis]|uniref:type II toxin-antitoxin system VapC family toxin n=1 Tax=Glaesserella parasuis TaxID=738 RepID=UPI0013121C27|nr:type II toxin-antitoxin system VapC family toxin [Glaesserella parasuis]MCT8535199.1 type II toxin-antitoxin system VapC family toxin [Glaesserella parasuis]MCT8560484.1 type II toxin-antitoxin system VapC family toxin [Glaesserella parasuis]MCT8572888.1 type II toxin-antitoxin system VapC family toxin [Glaesserella parasuis]MCT8582173.1 type II toxin-antitoxin system VapC family toxin [Glaesserella parasuis]MCT8586074.1 type II toxin-antitoxin system VapC family toxin [Glaesserella parasui